MQNELNPSSSKPEGAGMEISYSRINAYTTCPVKYRLIYEDGWHVPPNPFIALGLSIHRTLEGFHAAPAGSLDDLIEKYNECWVNEGFQTPQQAQEFYEKGERMLENYWNENRSAQRDVAFVEKEFVLPLGENRLRGLIDRIDRLPDGTYELIDYKTNVQLWPQEKADTDIQLSLYVHACEKALGITLSALSYYFLAHGVKLSTTRTREQIDAALATAEDVIARIRGREFSPDRRHCPKCDFRKSCPSSAAKNVKPA